MRHVCDNLLQLPVVWWPPYAVDMTQRYLPLMRAKLGPEYVEEFETGIVQPFVMGCVTCYDCGSTHTPAPWRNTTSNSHNKNKNSESSSSITKDQEGHSNNMTVPKRQGTNMNPNTKQQQQNKRSGNNKKKKHRK